MSAKKTWANSSIGSNNVPGWAMPRLFFSVKAVTGCRLEDVCSLLSVQLQDGRLVFPADITEKSLRALRNFAGRPLCGSRCL